MKNSDCVFCKIVEGTIPSSKVFENDKVLGFKDLQPSASQHYLFIHKTHSRDVNDMMAKEPTQVSDIYQAIREVTVKEGMEKQGFRVVTNMGPFAGQTVFHTHFHLLAGEPLRGFGR